MKKNSFILAGLALTITLSVLLAACIPGKNSTSQNEDSMNLTEMETEEIEQKMTEPVSESTELTDLEQELEETLIFEEDFTDFDL